MDLPVDTENLPYVAFLNSFLPFCYIFCHNNLIFCKNQMSNLKFALYPLISLKKIEEKEPLVDQEISSHGRKKDRSETIGLRSKLQKTQVQIANMSSI